MRKLINNSQRCKPENITIAELKEGEENFIVRLNSMQILVKPCEAKQSEYE